MPKQAITPAPVGASSTIAGDLADPLELIARKIELLEASAILQIAGEAAKIHEAFRYCRDEGGYAGYMKRRLGYSSSAAYRLLDVHTRFGMNLSQRWETFLPVSAIYLLAEPSTPEEVLKEIAGRIEAGNRPTVAEVRSAIKRAKGAAIEHFEEPEDETTENEPSDPAVNKADSSVTPEEKARIEAALENAQRRRADKESAGNGVDPADSGKERGQYFADTEHESGEPGNEPGDASADTGAPSPTGPEKPAGEQPSKSEQFNGSIGIIYNTGLCAGTLTPPNLTPEMAAEQREKIKKAIAGLHVLDAKLAPIAGDDAATAPAKSDAEMVDELVAAVTRAHELWQREGLWSSYSRTRQRKAKKLQDDLHKTLAGVREIAEFRTSAAAKAHDELAEQMASN